MYLRSFSEEDSLRFHFLVHTSLDIVDERLSSQRKPASGIGSPNELYLGLLCPTEDHRVYGYATLSRVKFIVVVPDNDSVKEIDVKMLFRHLHTLYVNTICDPFHNPDDALPPRFDRDVAAVLQKLDG
eukprot:TRINITY_DN5304_c0_g1_i1.p2 TRINITY_DN5304_c0_g1~~TRINITY_DN5304_c0_g1_i1.p2  ORF type:complete len:128 (+),score=26.27 TRINITY_DN5304_c0_g1_i1:109-492(+)